MILYLHPNPSKPQPNIKIAWLKVRKCHTLYSNTVPVWFKSFGAANVAFSHIVKKVKWWPWCCNGMHVELLDSLSSVTLLMRLHLNILAHLWHIILIQVMDCFRLTHTYVKRCTVSIPPFSCHWKCMLQEHHYCRVQLRGTFLFCIQLIGFSKTLTMSIYDCVFIHECKINFVLLGVRRRTEQDTPQNLNNLMTINNPTRCTCIYIRYLQFISCP